MISIIVIILLLLLCAFLSYKLYKFSMILLNLETGIEECLDILNERYESISSVLQREIFFDSVEVRQVINDIKISQDAIYVVASKLMGANQADEKESDKEDINPQQE